MLVVGTALWSFNSNTRIQRALLAGIITQIMVKYKRQSSCLLERQEPLRSAHKRFKRRYHGTNHLRQYLSLVPSTRTAILKEAGGLHKFNGWAAPYSRTAVAIRFIVLLISEKLTSRVLPSPPTLMEPSIFSLQKG